MTNWIVIWDKKYAPEYVVCNQFDTYSYLITAAILFPISGSCCALVLSRLLRLIYPPDGTHMIKMQLPKLLIGHCLHPPLHNRPLEPPTPPPLPRLLWFFVVIMLEADSIPRQAQKATKYWISLMRLKAAVTVVF